MSPKDVEQRQRCPQLIRSDDESAGTPDQRARPRRRRWNRSHDLVGGPAAAVPGGSERKSAGGSVSRSPRLHPGWRRAHRDEYFRRQPPQALGPVPRGSTDRDRGGRGQTRPRGPRGLGEGGARRRGDRAAWRPRRADRPRGGRAQSFTNRPVCWRAAGSTFSWSRHSSTSSNSSRRSPRCGRHRLFRSSPS